MAIKTWKERAAQMIKEEGTAPLPMAQRLALVKNACVEAEIKELRDLVADYEESMEDKRRLVREIDVMLNGDDAAKQASLCDIASEINNLVKWRDAIIKAARPIASYRMCMSYNDSYFGETKGLFKSRIAELDRLLPPIVVLAYKPTPDTTNGN